MAVKVEEHKEADAIQRARGFWLNNGRMLMYVGSAILVILGAWLVQKYICKIPTQGKANDADYVTKNSFSEFANYTSDA